MISFNSVLNIVPQVKYYPDFDPHGSHDGYVFDGIRRWPTRASRSPGPARRSLRISAFRTPRGNPCPQWC